MMRSIGVVLLTFVLWGRELPLVVAEPPPDGMDRPRMLGGPGMMPGSSGMGRPGMGGGPAFLEHVFPPELVMRYQNELELTSAQQDAMTRLMAETQAKLVELQWKLEAAIQTMTKLLAKEAVDEAAALAQWEQLSGLEQQIKKAHLSLLIHIKNQLTPSQQEKLRAVRFARPGPPRHGPGD